jgi:hypothetical protein
MNLQGRVSSLERKRSGKNCPVCFGHGRLVITCNTSYGEPSNPPLIGCEWCGEINHILIVESIEPPLWKQQQDQREGREP